MKRGVVPGHCLPLSFGAARQVFAARSRRGDGVEVAAWSIVAGGAAKFVA
jgi:hypothetical protein